MFRPRLIPVLLLKDNALVKSIKFKDCRYIGDPVNAVRLFNDLRADELLFLDITATAGQRNVNFELLHQIAGEADMPFGVGGGFRTLSAIKQAIAAGAEKIVIGAQAALDPNFVSEAAAQFGASTISVCIDVTKNIWGKEVVCINNGKKQMTISPLEMAALIQDKGAGELILQSVQRDGTMQGYDLDLVKRVATATTIPVVALGGGGSNADFRAAYHQGFASAVAAGSRFVYYGPRKGVLINYPEKTTEIFA